jgi:hypothetical protein
MSWLANIRHTVEVGISNFSPETICSDGFFIVFLAPLMQILGYYFKIDHITTSFPHTSKIIMFSFSAYITP